MNKRDLTRLKEIENSTRGLIRDHPTEIEAGGFLRMSVRVIQELDWLVKELKKALRGAKVEEDEEPVAVGQNVDL